MWMLAGGRTARQNSASKQGNAGHSRSQCDQGAASAHGSEKPQENFPGGHWAKCGTCKRKVHEYTEALECDMCRYWHHIECEDVPPQTYQFLHDNEENGIFWYCKKCCTCASKRMTGIAKLGKRHEELEIEVTKVKGEIESVKNELIVKCGKEGVTAIEIEVGGVKDDVVQVKNELAGNAIGNPCKK